MFIDHVAVKYESIFVMFATIINVYVDSGNIYLCLMCAIAGVNKHIVSIFFKYVNQWFRESKL